MNSQEQIDVLAPDAEIRSKCFTHFNHKVYNKRPKVKG